MSCHSTPQSPNTSPSRNWAQSTKTSAITPRRVADLQIMLLGNPNVGKSTVFNVLTGARQHVSNAPGTTVELQSGHWRGVRLHGRAVQITDLPGTYSLLARSPDERVTADAVAGKAGLGAPDAVVVLLDESNLSRSLYLLAQAREVGVPLIVTLTMGDVARSRGVEVDPHRLAEILRMPVVAINPREGEGLDELLAVIDDATAGAGHTAACPDPNCARTDGALGTDMPSSEPPVEEPLIDDLAHAEKLFAWVECVQRDLKTLGSARSCGCAGPACNSGSVTACADTGAMNCASRLPRPCPRAEARRGRRVFSDRLDEILLHPLAGIPVFLGVVWALFQVATAVAEPLMDGADWLVTGPLASLIRALMPGPAWLEGFLVDGVLAGVGTVLSFAPLMALMFFAISLLEDSGYLARAAFMADRAMRSIGLDGRAMLPLIVGFGCNVSALAATRTLPHARQRLLTALLIPYTSCAARLTVYILLAGAFFPKHAGTAIFAMYIGSILLVVLGGLVLRRTAFRDLVREPLVIALPAYQRPRVRALLTSTWVRVRAFIAKAGKIIVITLSVVWVLQAIPMSGEHAVGEVPVEDSLYGQVAEAITPVFEPAGFADWHATAALTTGFVAKEVVVGAFAQSYAVDEPADPANPGSLGAQLRATFEESSGGHGGAAAVAFMVFVLAYTPCLATVAEQQRMLGARWTWGAVAVQLVVAWALAVAVFQIGALL